MYVFFKVMGLFCFGFCQQRYRCWQNYPTPQNFNCARRSEYEMQVLLDTKNTIVKEKESQSLYIFPHKLNLVLYARLEHHIIISSPWAAWETKDTCDLLLQQHRYVPVRGTRVSLLIVK